MPHRIIRDAGDLNVLCTLLSNLKFPFTAQWAQGADRSLEQNALQFMWANETAQQRGDCTFNEVRCDWKLRHGVPILRRDNADFCAFYDRSLKHLPFEQKLVAMQFIPVTSEMGVRQMTEYLDAVQRECAEQGVILTDPETRQQRKEAA